MVHAVNQLVIDYFIIRRLIQFMELILIQYFISFLAIKFINCLFQNYYHHPNSYQATMHRLLLILPVLHIQFILTFPQHFLSFEC